MTEQEDALDDLHAAGVLEALRWAYRSAYDRVFADYGPETGHTQGWFGYTAHTLLADRLDRVFSCGKYVVESAEDAITGIDVLHDGLTQRDVVTMPRVEPGVVVRADVNGSPGWRHDEWRWLLASFRFGAVHHIQWAKRSATKQRVASQGDPDQLAFDPQVLGIPEVVDALADLASGPPSPTTTLVLGHSADLTSGEGELPIGRPRLNLGGGEAWYWIADLLSGPLPGARRGGDHGPKQPNGDHTNDVPDAPVRLRRRASKPGQASGPQ
jgi:hypothetical protein